MQCTVLLYRACRGGQLHLVVPGHGRLASEHPYPSQLSSQLTPHPAETQHDPNIPNLMVTTQLGIPYITGGSRSSGNGLILGQHMSLLCSHAHTEASEKGRRAAVKSWQSA